MIRYESRHCQIFPHSKRYGYWMQQIGSKIFRSCSDVQGGFLVCLPACIRPSALCHVHVVALVRLVPCARLFADGKSGPSCETSDGVMHKLIDSCISYIAIIYIYIYRERERDYIIPVIPIILLITYHRKHTTIRKGEPEKGIHPRAG